MHWKVDMLTNYVMDPFTETEVRQPVTVIAAEGAGVTLSLAEFVAYVNGLELLVRDTGGAAAQRLADIEAVFDDVGIEWNRKTAVLARMPHVTPEYVRAHAAAVADTQHLGLAINRMLRGKAAPGQGSYAERVKRQFPGVIS